MGHPCLAACRGEHFNLLTVARLQYTGESRDGVLAMASCQTAPDICVALCCLVLGSSSVLASALSVPLVLSFVAPNCQTEKGMI
jgi:multisubunit Na+/H+ antiporter MnhF subunit